MALPSSFISGGAGWSGNCSCLKKQQFGTDCFKSRGSKMATEIVANEDFQLASQPQK